MLTEEQKNLIIKALEERGAKLPCPRCSNTQFTILDGYFNQTLQTELKNISIGGLTIPSIVIGCVKCGFLSQHALGALGLLLPSNEGAKHE